MGQRCVQVLRAIAVLALLMGTVALNNSAQCCWLRPSTSHAFAHGSEPLEVQRILLMAVENALQVNKQL